MKKSGIFLLTPAVLAALSILLINSCGQPTASPELQIQVAVAETLASIPTNTPAPMPTSYPTVTPFSLENLFCSYRFCIGHPADVYLLDQGATRNPPIPSTYGYGIVFSYSQSIFLQIAWTLSGPSFDPQGTMKLILEETEQFQGSMETQLTGDLNVYYYPITISGQSLLPYGALAAWQCGGRDFAWKVYTPQDGMAPGLLKQALDRFKCE